MKPFYKLWHISFPHQNLKIPNLKHSFFTGFLNVAFVCSLQWICNAPHSNLTSYWFYNLYSNNNFSFHGWVGRIYIWLTSSSNGRVFPFLQQRDHVDFQLWFMFVLSHVKFLIGFFTIYIAETTSSSSFIWTMILTSFTVVVSIWATILHWIGRWLLLLFSGLFFMQKFQTSVFSEHKLAVIFSILGSDLQDWDSS